MWEEEGRNVKLRGVWDGNDCFKFDGVFFLRRDGTLCWCEIVRNSFSLFDTFVGYVQLIYETMTFVVVLVVIADVSEYSLSAFPSQDRDRGSWDPPKWVPGEQQWILGGSGLEEREEWEWQILVVFVVFPIFLNFCVVLCSKCEYFGLHHHRFFEEFDRNTVQSLFHAFFALLNVEALNWPWARQQDMNDEQLENEKFIEEKEFAVLSLISDAFHVSSMITILVSFQRRFVVFQSSDVLLR